MGAHLFDRRQHGKYVLTDAGETLVKQAVRIETAMFDIDREVQGSDKQLSGTIRVTTAEDIAVSILPPHLLAFSKAYPTIRVELLADNRYYNLGRGEADVAIRPGPGSEEDRVIPRKLCQLYFGLYASPEYLRTSGEPKSRADLKEHTVITWTAEVMDNVFIEFIAEISPSDKAPASNNLLAQRAMAECGMGISALPEFFGNMSEKLVRVMPDFRIESGNLWILHHDDLRHSARVRAFVDFMFEALHGDPNLPAS